MIEITLRHTAIRWDFSFFAVLAVFFLWDKSGFGTAALGICAAHELSHLAVMCLCGIVPDSVTFYGAGIRIASNETARRGAAAQAAVYAAGCAMNFLLAALLAALGRPYAAAISVSCGIFNLLPIGEFDGKKLLRLALIRLAPPERIDGILHAVGMACALSAALCVLIFGRGTSPTLLITAIYLIVTAARQAE